MHDVRHRGFHLTAVATALAVAAVAQQHKPTIIEFDAPGAGTSADQGTQAFQINPAGVIIGTYYDSTYEGHGYVLSPDGVFAAFTVPGAFYTYPQSINPKGEVTGYGFQNAVATGFLRSPDGTLLTFSLPGGGTGYGQGTEPLNINPEGEIAGIYIDANSVIHGFLRTPSGVITTFDAPGAGTGANQGTNMASYEGLSPSGDVVGWYIDANSVNHGYLRTPDGIITTFDAPGAGTGANQGTAGYGITPSGAIPGVYFDANSVLHGFLRSPDGDFTTIDVPGATGTNVQNINAAGVVDGDYYDANGASHGFVWTPSGSILKFDGPGAGTASGQGTFVGGNNAAGAVPGYDADANNVYHGFLWKP